MIRPEDLQQEYMALLIGKEDLEEAFYRIYQAGCEYMRQEIAKIAQESGSPEAADMILSIPIDIKRPKWGEYCGKCGTDLEDEVCPRCYPTPSQVPQEPQDP
jgi:hypothetical protein